MFGKHLGNLAMCRIYKLHDIAIVAKAHLEAYILLIPNRLPIPIKKHRPLSFFYAGIGISNAGLFAEPRLAAEVLIGNPVILIAEHFQSTLPNTIPAVMSKQEAS